HLRSADRRLLPVDVRRRELLPRSMAGMSSGEMTGVTSQYELTICTVSFHHAPHLRLNYDLVRRLNPDTKIRWVIGENSPLDSDRRLGADEFADTTVLSTESMGEEGMIG